MDGGAFVSAGLVLGRARARARARSRARPAVVCRPRVVVRATAAPARSTALGVEKGTKKNPYNIAVLPGDGAGPEVTKATLKVLEALSEYTELHFKFNEGLFGEPALAESGTEIPPETIQLCQDSDAVLKGYQGSTRGSADDNPDAVTAHVKLTKALGIFAQLRPLKIFPDLAAVSPLNSQLVDGLDIVLVREVSGGALRLANEPVGEKEATQSISYKEDEVFRIAEVALSIAEARNGKIHNVDVADRMNISSFWRTKMHQYIDDKTAGRTDIRLSDVYVDDFCREFIMRPKRFDVVVTSNLFGDMIAEMMSAVSGSMRISPSAWFSKEGTSVFGPADVFNADAYSGQIETSSNPIAMVRSASMMLRYGLNEPAAADLLIKAVNKVLTEMNSPAWGDKEVNTPNVSEAMIRMLEYMHTYEMVCSDVEECGE